ncbi:ADM_collapsed_G0020110.mRNA.1.CDS.1 [Saccharomyces cerevisiae]|nr:ADM_collapsed_G0020110.mRNA.1.CDS.1 [Saccharomyces cerevisiae]
MAPKKKSNDRAIQAKGSEEDYLVSQYKPFSVNDIVQNLHNKVTKTTATKALENLVNEKRIVSKTFGKIIIYSCNEQDTALPSNIDPSQFDFETVLQLRNDLIELERDKSMAKDALDSVTKEPENEDLLTIIENEENELKRLNQNYKVYRMIGIQQMMRLSSG